MMKLFRKKDSYDPRDIEQHKGVGYSTSYSYYSIDRHGCFHGRDSLEGAELELVAGLDTKYTKQITKILDNQERRKLKRLVLKHGEKPTAGKYLVVVLTKTDSERRNTIGLKSSPLEGLL